MGSHAALHRLPPSRYGSIFSIFFGIGAPGLLFCPSSFQNHNSPSVFSVPGVYSSKCFFYIDPSSQNDLLLSTSFCLYLLLVLRNRRQSSHLTVGLQGRWVPQLNMKAHHLLSFTARLQLFKQCLPS